MNIIMKTALSLTGGLILAAILPTGCGKTESPKQAEAAASFTLTLEGCYDKRSELVRDRAGNALNPKVGASNLKTWGETAEGQACAQTFNNAAKERDQARDQARRNMKVE